MSLKIKIDTSGLDNLSKKLNSISGKRKVQLRDILTPSFISSYSKYSDLNSFMSGCGINSVEDFEAFPEEQMDNFVKSNTKFSSWKDMITSATTEYYKNQLGL